MPTDPLTGSRYPSSTAVPNVNQDIQNAVVDLSDNTIPDFSTTTARDNAWAAWVALGNSLRNGLHSVVNGVRYRRIGGNWRIDGNRNIQRTVTPTGGAATILAGGAAETGVTSGAAALSSLTLYEAGTIKFDAAFRAGSNTTAALCSVKIDGAVVGNTAVSRFNPDGTVNVTGTLALAAGSHTVALRVDTTGGGGANWVDGRITIAEGIAE